MPRSLDFALPEAVGEPVVVTGGQAPAHAPVQLDVPPVSLVNRYTARPELLVRNVPADVEAVEMAVAPDAAALLLEALLVAAAPAAELAGALAVLLLPLEHAATSSATAATPPTPAAILADAGTRFPIETRISLVSHLAAGPAVPGPLRVGCRYRYERGVILDWNGAGLSGAPAVRAGPGLESWSTVEPGPGGGSARA